MSKNADPLAAKLVAAALELRRSDLWEVFGDGTCLLVRLSDDPSPIVIDAFDTSDLGRGLMLFCGPSALEAARKELVARHGDTPSVGSACLRLGVTYARVEQLPPLAHAILLDSGVRVGSGSLAPQFVAVRPPGPARIANRTEMRTTLEVLKTLLDARKLGPFGVTHLLFSSEACVLHRIEHPKGPPTVEIEREALPITEIRLAPEYDRNALRAAPQGAAVWILGFIETAALQESSRAPMNDSAFVIVDQDSGSIVLASYGRPTELNVIAAELFDLMVADSTRGRGARPSRVLVLHAGVAAWLAPVLREIEIEVSSAESSARFVEVVAKEMEAVEYLLADGIGDVPPEPKTEPKTVEEWKNAEKVLTTAIADFVFSVPEELEEAAGVFFFASDGMRWLESRRYDVRTAFVEWYITRWDEAIDELPLVPRWRRLARSAAIRHLLDERAKGRLSIYRVEAIVPESGSLALIDIWTGERETVLDRALVRSARVDTLLPLRCFETPVATFVSIAGPALDPLEFGAMIHALEIEGEPLTREVLRAAPERLALLFRAQEEAERRGAGIDRNRGVPLTVESKTASTGAEDRATAESSLRELVRQQHLRWLDTPLPILRGRTPREAAQSEEGKYRVAMLIRTLPTMRDRQGTVIEPPRSELLRAVGVEDRAASG